MSKGYTSFPKEEEELSSNIQASSRGLPPIDTLLREFPPRSGQSGSHSKPPLEEYESTAGTTDVFDAGQSSSSIIPLLKTSEYIPTTDPYRELSMKTRSLFDISTLVSQEASKSEEQTGFASEKHFVSNDRSILSTERITPSPEGISTLYPGKTPRRIISIPFRGQSTLDDPNFSSYQAAGNIISSTDAYIYQPQQGIQQSLKREMQELEKVKEFKGEYSVSSSRGAEPGYHFLEQEAEESRPSLSDSSRFPVQIVQQLEAKGRENLTEEQKRTLKVFRNRLSAEKSRRRQRQRMETMSEQLKRYDKTLNIIRNDMNALLRYIERLEAFCRMTGIPEHELQRPVLKSFPP